jgi:hypothetical protein
MAKAKTASTDKAAKFKELATARVNRVLKGIAQIGNLSSKNYERTDAQVRAIFDALQSAVESCEARFQGTAKPDGFSL